MELVRFIREALIEDIGDGDHTSLACIDKNTQNKARLLVKDEGIIAGIDIAKIIFDTVDSSLQIKTVLTDGDHVKHGDVAFYVSGSAQSILAAERLVLNLMQRMSAIATQTFEATQILKGLKTKVLDTRKTTPLLRQIEKQSVKIGGGVNHRFGLYDMIMLKDNHIDYAGGITQALAKTRTYLKETGKFLEIEVEARTIDDVYEILANMPVKRIMLDNFSIENTLKAVSIIGGLCETESSGGITLKNLRDYANCGVDYISMGALTHSVICFDLSLKAC